MRSPSVKPSVSYLEQVASLLHPRDRNERIRVGIALNEALLNAIQHGNLELDSDLRQEEEQVFRDLGEERRRQPPYRDRRVHVRATLSRSEAVYVVEDEGPGFDPATLPVSTDPANLERIKARLEARGVQYLGPDRGVTTSIYFKDPDGIQIELIAEPLRIMDGRALG